jgi:hypothetical protein
MLELLKCSIQETGYCVTTADNGGADRIGLGLGKNFMLDCGEDCGKSVEIMNRRPALHRAVLDEILEERVPPRAHRRNKNEQLPGPPQSRPAGFAYRHRKSRFGVVRLAKRSRH